MLKKLTVSTLYMLLATNFITINTMNNIEKELENLKERMCIAIKKSGRIKSPGCNSDNVENNIIGAIYRKRRISQNGIQDTYIYKEKDTISGKSSPTIAKKIFTPHTSPTNSINTKITIKHSLPSPSDIDKANKKLNKMEKQLTINKNQIDSYKKLRNKNRISPTPKPKFKKIKKGQIDIQVIKETVKRRTQSTKSYNKQTNIKNKQKNLTRTQENTIKTQKKLLCEIKKRISKINENKINKKNNMAILKELDRQKAITLAQSKVIEAHENLIKAMKNINRQDSNNTSKKEIFLKDYYQQQEIVETQSELIEANENLIHAMTIGEKKQKKSTDFKPINIRVRVRSNSNSIDLNAIKKSQMLNTGKTIALMEKRSHSLRNKTNLKIITREKKRRNTYT